MSMGMNDDDIFVDDTTNCSGCNNNYKSTSSSHNHNQQCDDKKYCILALYEFINPVVTNEQVYIWKNEIENELRKYDVRGMIILAIEGINGTICYPKQYNNDVESFLTCKFTNLRTRKSYSNTYTFHRLRVRIKNEIVTLGSCMKRSSCNNTNTTNDNKNNNVENNANDSNDVLRPINDERGIYVKPGIEWDTLIHDPNCLVIDTRNEYEILLGTFENAINPHTNEFTEFPTWLQNQLQKQKQKQQEKSSINKIAMFCTGGIRCEKATAYCKNILKDYIGNDDNNNIPEVYHLEGGILGYLDTIPKEQSTYHGECYVFDQRTAVTHGLQPTKTYTLCRACRHPLNRNIDCVHNNEYYKEGVYCPYCYNDDQRRRQRYVDRQKQIELDTNLGRSHMYDGKKKNK